MALMHNKVPKKFNKFEKLQMQFETSDPLFKLLFLNMKRLLKEAFER
jgi:hypothetical protein